MMSQKKAAAVTALRWALGLSAGFILGPIVLLLASGTEVPGKLVAEKLVVGVVLFPFLFFGLWAWGALSKRDPVTGAALDPKADATTLPISNGVDNNVSIPSASIPNPTPPFQSPLVTRPGAPAPSAKGTLQAAANMQPPRNLAPTQAGTTSLTPTQMSASQSAGTTSQAIVNPTQFVNQSQSPTPVPISPSTEEDCWAAAMNELESGQRRPGIWAKAFAEAEGDETKAKVASPKASLSHSRRHRSPNCFATPIS